MSYKLFLKNDTQKKLHVVIYKLLYTISIFIKLGFSMKLTHLSPVQYLIYCYLNRGFYTWQYNLIKSKLN